MKAPSLQGGEYVNEKNMETNDYRKLLKATFQYFQADATMGFAQIEGYALALAFEHEKRRDHAGDIALQIAADVTAHSGNVKLMQAFFEDEPIKYAVWGKTFPDGDQGTSEQAIILGKEQSPEDFLRVQDVVFDELFELNEAPPPTKLNQQNI